MSDTTQLFILAGFWTMAAAVLVYFIPKWPVRIVVFVLVVGVPFWELPFGYYNFLKLCKEDGGLRVFQSISPQKTICAAYPFDFSAQSLLRFGFERVEAKTRTGEIVRYARNSREGDSQGKSNKIESEFCVTFANNIFLPSHVIRHDFLITRASDGSVVARHSVFDWFGMWWQAAASPILGRGGECRDDPVQAVMSALLVGSSENSAK